MKFVRDDEAARWLSEFIPDPDNLDWDAGNRTKNMKHRVQGEEVESIFYSQKFIFAEESLTRLTMNGEGWFWATVMQDVPWLSFSREEETNSARSHAGQCE